MVGNPETDYKRAIVDRCSGERRPGRYRPQLQNFYLSGSRGALTLPQWLDLNGGIVAMAHRVRSVGRVLGGREK